MFWHVEGRNCCKDCFAHTSLRDYVSEESCGIGTCQYCGKRKRELIEVAKLARPFENLMTLYSRSEFGGDSLIDLVQGDWEVFNVSFYDGDGASRLLTDILLAGWDDDSGEPVPDADDLYERKIRFDLLNQASREEEK
jgi:hypothetical protein